MPGAGQYSNYTTNSRNHRSHQTKGSHLIGAVIVEHITSKEKLNIDARGHVTIDSTKGDINIGNSNNFADIKFGTVGNKTIKLGRYDTDVSGEVHLQGANKSQVSLISSGITIKTEQSDTAEINIGTDSFRGPINIGTLGSKVTTIGFQNNDQGGNSMCIYGNNGGSIIFGSTGLTVENMSGIFIGANTNQSQINIGTGGARTINIGGSQTNSVSVYGAIVNIGTDSNTNNVYIGTSATSDTMVKIGEADRSAGTGTIILQGPYYSSISLDTDGISMDHQNGPINIGIGNNTFAINIGTGGTRDITIGDLDGSPGVLKLYGGSGTESGIIMNTSGIALSNDTKISIEVTNHGGLIDIGTSHNCNITIGTITSTSQVINLGTKSDMTITAGTFYLDIGLSAATNGQVLTCTGSSNKAEWQTLAGGSSVWTTSGTHISNNNSGNVGIGTTTTPGAKLEINGQIKITGGSVGNTKVLTSDNNGLASWAPTKDSGWERNQNRVFQTTIADNVGIGLDTPGDIVEKLYVKGSIVVENGYPITGNQRCAGYYVWKDDEAFGLEWHYDQAGHISTTNYEGFCTCLFGRKNVGTTNLTKTCILFGSYPGNATGQSSFSEYMRIDNTGFVGINCEQPSAHLEVCGTFTFTDGNETSGYILTCGTNGSASWAAPAGGGSTWASSGGVLSPISTTDIIEIPTSIQSGSANFAIGSDVMEFKGKGTHTLTYTYGLTVIADETQGVPNWIYNGFTNPGLTIPNYGGSGTNSDHYGCACAISTNGGIVCIGEYLGRDVYGAQSGRVWTYILNSGSPDYFTLFGPAISPLANAVSNSRYGESLALSSNGDVLVVGHSGAGQGAGHGRIWVYNKGSSLWTYIQVITDPTAGGPASSDIWWPAWCLDVSPDGLYLIGGSRTCDTTGGVSGGGGSGGRVTFFRRASASPLGVFSLSTNSGNATTPNGEYYGLSGKQCGSDAKIDSNGRIVVGEILGDVSGVVAGIVRIFNISGTGATATWLYQFTINNPTPDTNDYFGMHVSIVTKNSTTLVMAGAYLDDNSATNDGAISTYTISGNTSTALGQILTGTAAGGRYLGQGAVDIIITSDGTYIMALGQPNGTISPLAGGVGFVSVYRYDTGAVPPQWVQIGVNIHNGTINRQLMGSSMRMSPDGKYIVMGAMSENAQTKPQPISRVYEITTTVNSGSSTYKTTSLSVTGNMYPTADNVYNLGSTSNAYKTAYFRNITGSGEDTGISRTTWNNGKMTLAMSATADFTFSEHAMVMIAVTDSGVVYTALYHFDKYTSMDSTVDNTSLIHSNSGQIGTGYFGSNFVISKPSNSTTVTLDNSMAANSVDVHITIIENSSS